MATNEQLANNNNLVRKEKRFFFVVIYLMFYNGKEKTFLRDMCIPTAIFRIWLEDLRVEATQFIDDYQAKIKGGKKNNDKDTPVPTVDELKQQIMVKMQKAITIETDPSKLANTLKIINGYGKEKEEADNSKKSNIYDDIKNSK